MRLLIGLLIASIATSLRADVIIAPPNSKTVRYGESRHQVVTLYRARSKTSAPTVLLFGQPRRQFGDPNWSLQFLIGGLVDSGIAVVGINLPGDRPLDDATEVKQALAFLGSRAAEYRLDMSRIAIAGHGSGAHLASLVSTDPAYLAAAGLPFASVRGAALLDGSIQEAEPPLMPQAQTAPPNAPVFLVVHPKFAVTRARPFAELAAALRQSGSPVVERTMTSGDGIAVGSPSDRTTKEALIFLRNRLR